jgi:hypothetical protein
MPCGHTRTRFQLLCRLGACCLLSRASRRRSGGVPEVKIIHRRARLLPPRSISIGGTKQEKEIGTCFRGFRHSLHEVAQILNCRLRGSNRQPVILSAGYAASRISSNLEGNRKHNGDGVGPALKPLLFRPYDQSSSGQTDSWRSCPAELRIHSLRTAFMKSSTFRFMDALLTLRCCSMLMPVKNVRIISASRVGFILGFSASIFLTSRSLRNA